MSKLLVRLAPHHKGTDDVASGSQSSYSPMMKPLTIFVLGWLMTALAANGWADDVRFSKNFTEIERSETGLERLSAEQVSILDALVQRDEATIAVEKNAATLPSPRFSQRLAPDKRHSAGLDLLTPAELARLDTLVERKLAEKVSVTGEASRIATLKPEDLRIKPEIHGEIGLTYGVGSHGYSERGGYIALSYDDPNNRYSISVLYSEMQIKGPGWSPYSFGGPNERRYLERGTKGFSLPPLR